MMTAILFTLAAVACVSAQFSGSAGGSHVACHSNRRRRRDWSKSRVVFRALLWDPAEPDWPVIAQFSQEITVGHRSDRRY